MPTTNYNMRFIESASGVGCVVSRNSTTSIVDATSGAPNRLKIPKLTDFAAGVTVATISDATNATPIVLTVDDASAAGIATNDLILVEGVLGNTNANGTFFVTVSSNSVTLVGSAGNAAYTSGGKARKLALAPSYHIALMAACQATLNDKAAGN